MQKLYRLFFLLIIPVFSFSQDVRVPDDQRDAQVAFGIQKINEKAAAVRSTKTASLSVDVVIDSVKAVSLVRSNNWKPLKRFGDQCYSIRIQTNGKKKNIYVLSGETTGAMYGLLDIAEAIECNTIDQLTESDNAPYLINRGIKFNIPLDLRTPGYSDPGDSFQQNIGDVWDIGFWQTFFDEMAVHRYNVMTLWSLQPFPSLVKVPEFPGTSLNDVWRTKEKYDDSYSSMGLNFDRPHLFANVEVVKKMTIDEKIVFWKKVMQLAADRGIDMYLFTWNIFTYGVTGIQGITRRQDNDTTIAWYRAAVREMIKTYPLLRGIGITSGEGMDNTLKGEYANEQWLWKTYGEGIRDGLKDQPNRKFTLVHRFHWASLNEIQAAFKNLPCRLELSLKYAIAHMYSITNPQFVLPAMPLLSPQLQSWLTIRNDDIYSFRWANNKFARAFIKNIPDVEKIAGFYMGPDGYCWGRDYLSRLNAGKTPPLMIQKQWYSFMLWGRLGYNPDLPDRVFLQHLPQHFPRINTAALMEAWSNASSIFPLITSFIWGDIDLKWFPEANISHPNHKGFYSVKDYIEREPIQGSNIEGILPWRDKYLRNEKDTLITPLLVAGALESLGWASLAELRKLPAPVTNAPDEINQTLSDIECFVFIGKYYAEKIRAACYLALLDTTKNEDYRVKSLMHLKLAEQNWNEYSSRYTIKNYPALYHRVGYVDMEKLKEKVKQDIEIVQNWKPGVTKLTGTQRTEVPFKQ